jgi:Domain of unknown function (DUF4258)
MLLNFLRIEYSKHTLERMRVRRVSRRLVGVAILDPDFLHKAVESGALVAVKKQGRRHVVVIFAVSDGRVRVITVYHSSDVEGLLVAS